MSEKEHKKVLKKEVVKPINNHVEEYFDATGDNKSSELFRIEDNKDLDFKTDLDEEEIKLITSMFMTDQFLIKKGIGAVFESYYNKYLRLRVSKDRQGRGEFVSMNSQEKTGDILDKLGNVTNIVGAKK